MRLQSGRQSFEWRRNRYGGKQETLSRRGRTMCAPTETMDGRRRTRAPHPALRATFPSRGRLYGRRGKMDGGTSSGASRHLPLKGKALRGTKDGGQAHRCAPLRVQSGKVRYSGRILRFADDPPLRGVPQSVQRTTGNALAPWAHNVRPDGCGSIVPKGHRHCPLSTVNCPLARAAQCAALQYEKGRFGRTGPGD